MSWQHVRGHDENIAAFERAVRRGRLAHAYLFIGPEGVGKKLFALELAKALLCENPPSDKLAACDHCSSCTLVDAGNHPDLFQAARPEEKLEFPIEVMRELCHNFSLKPARGHGKVAIIDDADDLNEESANCFLKTLEEPPPRSVIILIGTKLDRQLPTVVSRCQVVRFAPLDQNVVKELLNAGDGIEPSLVDKLACMSGGSLGRAQELADSALWKFRRTLLDTLVRPRFDSVALAKTWTEFVEEAGKEAASQRRRAAVVLRLLIGFLRDALALCAGDLPKLAEPDDAKALQEMINRCGPERLLLLLERCLEADEQIDRRVQLVLVLEALMDALSQRLEAKAG